MKLTSRICIIAMTIIMTSCLTGCEVKNRKQTIPAVNEIDIAEAVKTLDVSTEDFEAFLNNIDTTYDDYIAQLNDNNKSLEDMKKDIEATYDCSYEEYIKAVLVVNNKNVPDSNIYELFESKYSTFDTYIPLEELNETKTELKNYDISFEIADESEYAYAFDAIAYTNGNFKTYMDYLNQVYGCKSAELTNISIFGGHGVNKPEEENKCLNSLFVFDEKTNEILEKIAVPVLTLHNEDENKNITLALCNELGLVFKTTGADSYDKMLRLGNLDFQIRNTSSSTDDNK